MVLVNGGFYDAEVKIEVAFLLDRVGLPQLVDLQPALQRTQVVGQVEDAGEVD